MRSSVPRIFPPDHAYVTAAFYTLLLFLFLASAPDTQARPVSFPALKIQAQQPRPRAKASADAQKKRGLSPLQNDEAPEGSRVTITYNEPLSDYSAYRRGDQFVVVIPKSDAPRIRSGLRGRGFEGVQVEKRGEDTVLSFRIQPGTKARVDQQNNRLEVIFSKPGQATATNPQQANSSAAAAVKTPQGTQATTGLPPQTPLANHNSTDVNQPAGVASTASATAPATSSSAAAPTDATLSPSTEGAASPTQASTDNSTTAGVTPAPAASPGTTFAAPKMLIGRYWLPLLIAIVLLASAYLSLIARRRSALNNDETVERAELTEETQSETNSAAATTSRAEVAAVTQGSNGESAPAHKATEIEVVAAAASLPHRTANEVAQVTSVSNVADLLSVERKMETERSAGEAPEVNSEATDVEVQQELWAQAIENDTLIESGQEEAQEAEIIEEAILNKEPLVLDEAPSVLADTGANGFATDAENERVASVLRLAGSGSDDAFVKIGAAFDDPAQAVRDAAARSLFNFSADRVASFKRIMQESSQERRRKIGAAIVSSGMATEAINDLTSASGEKAYDALLVLSLMAKAGEVQSLVETIEEHPSTEVRLALVKLLALSGQGEVVSAFRYLATRDQLPIAVRSSIMEAIYQINNPRPFDLS